MPSAYVEMVILGMQQALLLAQDSRDPSTQNGAVIAHSIEGEMQILSSGINSFCTQVQETPERWERPLKYQFVEHAERNAVYNATKYGKSIAGATLYVPFRPCVECARAIIQTGIDRVVCHKTIALATPDHWKESLDSAESLLSEAGVALEVCDFPKFDIPLRFNGVVLAL
jgi:dCMP deaminase